MTTESPSWLRSRSKRLLAAALVAIAVLFYPIRRAVQYAADPTGPKDCPPLEPEPAELARTFNCGIGMVAIIAAEDAPVVTERLEQAGETVHRIGLVEAGESGCTVSGSAGTWTARDGWTATHHG